MPSHCGIKKEWSQNTSYCISSDDCKIVGENFCGQNRTEMMRAYKNGTPECAHDNDCSMWKSYWDYKPNKDPSRCGFEKVNNDQYCVSEE